jgi:NADH-quinone oxidoreductase subunit E
MTEQSINPVPPKCVLSDKVQGIIDHWVKKYPKGKQRSAVVAALLAAQEEQGGWLSADIMDAVAAYLQLQPIQVYEVATFYDMIETRPNPPKHKLAVCTNLSCQLRDCDRIVAHLKKRLGIGLGERTQDGLVELKEVECLAACSQAPVAQLDNDLYLNNLTPDQIDTLLQSWGLELRDEH